MRLVAKIHNRHHHSDKSKHWLKELRHLPWAVTQWLSSLCVMVYREWGIVQKEALKCMLQCNSLSDGLFGGFTMVMEPQ
jgi:hypothetical protein